MSTPGSYLVIPSQGRFHLSALRSPVILTMSILATSILLAAIYYLSIPQLLIAAVAAVLVMAIIQRTAKLQAFSENCTTQNLDCSDGGSFSVNALASTKKQSDPVVFDGGSFERSSKAKPEKH